MKVGIVTVHDSFNMGSYLQALALQEIIKSNGDEPYIVKTRSNIATLSLFFGYNMAPAAFNIKSFISFYIRLLFNPKKLLFGLKKYKSYKNDWSKFERIISITDAKKLDIILYGSDEIWNVAQQTFKNPIFYGKYFNKESKSAYAVSIGNALIEQFEEVPEIISLIKKYDKIFVRDEYSADILSQLGINISGKICDPTLQFDLKNQLNKGIYKTDKKYIAVYSYGMPKDIVEKIKHFAEERNLKTVAVSLYQDWCDEYCNCSPLDFGKVLSGAEYVFTTTFHGTIFSALYHTKFASYSKLPKVIDVLDSLCLSNSRLQEGFSFDDLVEVLEQQKDYTTMEKELHKLRQISKKAYNDIMNRPYEFNGVCNYENCTGCSTCAFVCPKECITMKENSIGVIYPEIDKNQCIDCGKCERVCPQFNRVQSNYPLKAYAAWSKDEEERRTSASGGIAAEIYKKLITEGYYIVGAKTNTDFSVELVVSNNIELIKEFKNSKYVFSNMAGLFNELEKLVENKEKICMIGTPCQIAAVRNTFPNYSNIVYIDLVCHGIAPYSYLKQHIDSLNVCANKLFFRDPNKDTSKYYFSLYNNDYCVYSKRMVHGDTYQIGYHKGINYRNNCYNCIYANSNRVGDITISDYKGLGSVMPANFGSHKVSSVLINTEKGQSIINLVNNIVLNERPVEEPISGDKQLRHPTEKTKYRYEFEKQISKNGGDYEKAINKVIESMNNDNNGQGLIKRLWKKLYK